MATSPCGQFESEFARTLCQRVAGPYFEDMSADYGATRHHLTHADPRARLGALFLLREYWEPVPDFPQICENLAVHDGDVGVRSGALSSLCGCYYRTSDARMGMMLAQLVRAENAPLKVRHISYLALCSLAGRPAKVRPDFQFPDDVDWDLVHRFAGGPLVQKINGSGNLDQASATTN